MLFAARSFTGNTDLVTACFLILPVGFLFISKTFKTTKDGWVPVYLTINYKWRNGVRFEQTTRQYIRSTKWSVESGSGKMPTVLDIMEQYKAILFGGSLILIVA